MFRSLLHQIQRTHGFSIDIPDDIEALKRTLASALFTASKSGQIVLVVDGADGIAGQSPEAPLAWLPHHLPPQVRMIVSTFPGPTLDDALRRSWRTLETPALDPEERERLITAYLDRFAKSLSNKHKARIVAHPHSANPRFLGVLLDELRWTGDYATLGETLEGCLSVADITELYGSVLDRCEENYERDRPGLVEDAVCLLWAAREGLSESELKELLGDGDERLPHALWSPLELAAEAVIINRSGLIGLRNHQVRRAVEAKYLNEPERRRGAHLRLAAYFSGSDHNQRRAVEMPWQLVQAEQWAELFDALTDEQMVIDIWNENPWDLRHYWAELTRHTERSMADGYSSMIEHPGKHPHSAGLVAQLLVNGGYLHEALPLARQLVDQARRAGDAGRLVVALNNLSPILAAQGDLDARLDCARELEAVALEAGDKQGIAGALANRAGVHLVRGELEKAASLYREEQELRGKLGDRDGLQYCLGNQAQILVDQADLDGAMHLRREQERLSREIGNLHGLRIALGTQAVIHRMWGNLEMAIQLHREEERLCHETGDKAGLQVSLGNQALIIRMQGDLDTALEMFRQQEKICRELGILQDLATSLNNQAGILVQHANLEGAMRLYQEQEQICRQLGYDLGLQASLGNQGLLRMHLDDIAGAVELFRSQEEICRRRGFPEYLAHCLNNLVMPLQVLGCQEEANAAASEALELVERYKLSTRR
jgi:tetratricopeptide (TPR) repeat protein